MLPEATTAVGELETLGVPARRAAVEPLLDDPMRAVRVQAARVLAEAWTPRAAGASLALTAAAAEYLNAQAAVADMPAAHLSLGVVHQRQGASDRAEAEYVKALALDPWFTPARFNLANRAANAEQQRAQYRRAHGPRGPVTILELRQRGQARGVGSYRMTRAPPNDQTLPITFSRVSARNSIYRKFKNSFLVRSSRNRATSARAR